MYKEEKSNIVNIFTSTSSIASQHFQVFVVFHINTQRESIVGPTVTVAKSTQVLTFGKFIFKNLKKENSHTGTGNISLALLA